MKGLQRADVRGGYPPAGATDGVRSRYQNAVYEPQSGQFVYHEGAATHANLLLGDEINRTSSNTQSALLEAMEEHQVTVRYDAASKQVVSAE